MIKTRQIASTKEVIIFEKVREAAAGCAAAYSSSHSIRNTRRSAGKERDSACRTSSSAGATVALRPRPSARYSEESRARSRLGRWGYEPLSAVAAALHVLRSGFDFSLSRSRCRTAGPPRLSFHQLRSEIISSASRCFLPGKLVFMLLGHFFSFDLVGVEIVGFGLVIFWLWILIRSWWSTLSISILVELYRIGP